MRQDGTIKAIGETKSIRLVLEVVTDSGYPG